jgi:hypothetical protein
MSCVLKENIIGGILDVLHWASWVDYIDDECMFMQGGSTLWRCRGSRAWGLNSRGRRGVLKMVTVDVLVVGFPCWWSSHGGDRHASYIDVVIVEGGDAEVDAVRAVVDIEEWRRRNRGIRGENRRVDAVKPPQWGPVLKSMQSSRLSEETGLELPDPATRRGPKHMMLPIPGV